MSCSSHPRAGLGHGGAAVFGSTQQRGGKCDAPAQPILQWAAPEMVQKEKGKQQIHPMPSPST